MAAGTSYMTFQLDNGQTLSVLISTSAAIGTIPTVNTEGVATSTTNTDFTVKSKTRIRDQINIIGTCATCTAGQCEIFNVTRSARTGKFVDNTVASYAATVADRPVPAITFMPGQVYRFIQTSAQVSA